MRPIDGDVLFEDLKECMKDSRLTSLQINGIALAATRIFEQPTIELEKYEEIEVGDEIRFSDGTTGYIIMPDYNEKDMLVSTSDCACLQLIRKSNKNPFFKWEKTGMRNGEIVKMVKAIKEES